MVHQHPTTARDPRPHGDDLLLRETNHRCANDLQLVVGMLLLQSRRAASAETRAALADVTARVAVLARARAELQRRRQPCLESALRQVCEALHSQAEPRAILISMEARHEVPGLTPDQVTTLALVVNELATNAIKHAFAEGEAGHIHILVRRDGERGAAILVDDDGLPFPVAGSPDGGMGLGLVKRLVASVGGMLIPPTGTAKCFEIRLPASFA